jgi:hypothetical protein
VDAEGGAARGAGDVLGALDEVERQWLHPSTPGVMVVAVGELASKLGSTTVVPRSRSASYDRRSASGRIGPLAESADSPASVLTLRA